MLSKRYDLEKTMVKIINEYKYFEKLSETFSKNYLKVRKKWFELDPTYPFILLFNLFGVIHLKKNNDLNYM